MKMSTGRQLFYAVATLVLVSLCSEILAEIQTADNAISNLYENLLQREYAGPVVFPNHQVERKAQRSPSLRLRFGRRSDPEMPTLQRLPSAEKRWFGDVNQKPIRSPSLRLRFGRRSDPSMPLHSQLDELMNIAGGENSAAAAGTRSIDLDDDDYDEDFNGVSAFERVLRKPQRLRWGRSVPFEGTGGQGQNGNNGNNNNMLEDETDHQRTDDYYNALVNTQKLRNILLALRGYDDEARLLDSADVDSGEFQREVRKPGPLRLRWGRSTGGRPTAAVQSDEQKNTPEVHVEKAEVDEKNKA